MSGTETSELLVAVRAFLREGVLPELDDFKAYNTRIAANVLGIVQRELDLGAELAELDRQMGQALGLDPQAASVPVQIARALRDGSLAADETLLSYLRRRTLLSIRIDNPKYSGLQQAHDRWGEPGGN